MSSPRYRIINGAADLFADRDIQAVSVSDIAQSAGVARGSINYYFATKREIALAVIDEAERKWQEISLARPVIESVDSVEQLKVEVKEFLTTLLDSSLLRAGIRLCRSDEFKMTAKASNWHVDGLARIRQLLERSDGRPQAHSVLVSTHDMAETVMTLIIGETVRCSESGHVDPGRLALHWAALFGTVPDKSDELQP